jgi:hypothetical protein
MTSLGRKFGERIANDSAGGSMNDETLTRLEAEATEVLRTLKELFGEFERRLGEAVSAQRLASSEARTEAADARALLRKLVQRAEETANDQRAALNMLRENWWLNIEENAKASGAQMAFAFGEEIAAGLEKRLQVLSVEVERATRRFGWMTALKWGAGVAAGIVLTILIGVRVFTPGVDGLTRQQVRTVMARIGPCTIGKESHVCVAVDPEESLRYKDDQTWMAIRGM